ncbi:MAG: Mu-like prophage major head subunit gpT family protein [Zoogloeaceae bacterium]|jgi:phage major head subunit gpT-like protein|nr:Mu-like prophage major head subunit gpT family protein [Zoogloeaceae bacterium]
MQITPHLITLLSQGFNAAFIKAIESVPATWPQIAMQINSQSNAENYGWVKDLPGMREWIGQRVVNNLESTTAVLQNRKWEHTIGLKADDIEDDRIGIYSNIIQQQAEIAARHPDDLVWALLRAGFTTPGFDGQPFFDADHAGFDKAGKEISWSNVQTGTGNAWYAFDLSRSYLKPLIFQLRKPATFTRKTNAEDDHVFLNGEYLYGVEARYNAGFGFHQLAYASTNELSAANWEAAKIALSTQYRPDGSALGVRATHLVVGSTNEGRARTLLESTQINGSDNIWKGSAQLLVSPYLD